MRTILAISDFFVKLHRDLQVLRDEQKTAPHPEYLRKIKMYMHMKYMYAWEMETQKNKDFRGEQKILKIRNI